MQVRAGVVTSFVAHASAAVFGILAVPFFVKAFGPELYGFWSALLGLTAYLGLLNLGVSQTVSSRLSTVGEAAPPEAVTAVVRKGIGIYLKVCALAAPVVAAVAVFVPWASLFGIEASSGSVLRGAAVALLLAFLIELPFSVFRAALRGLGHVTAERTTLIAVALVRFVIAWLCSVLYPPLWLAVLALFGANLLGHVACGVLLGWNVPGLFRLRTAAPAPDSGSLRFASASFHFLLLQFAGALVWSTDAVFAGVLLGATQAARVSIAWRVLSVGLNFGALVGPALSPALAQAWARGDKALATRLATEASQLVFGATLLVTLVALSAGRPLFEVWVGESMFLGPLAWSAYCLILPVQGLLTIPAAFSVQAGRHERYARWVTGEALLKAILTVVMVPPLGLFGIPLATLAARSGTTLWVLPIVFAREMGLSAPTWIATVLRPALVPTAAFVSVWAVREVAWGELAGWVGLAFAAGNGLVFGALFVSLGLPTSVRKRLFRWPGSGPGLVASPGEAALPQDGRATHENDA